MKYESVKDAMMKNGLDGKKSCSSCGCVFREYDTPIMCWRNNVCYTCGSEKYPEIRQANLEFEKLLQAGKDLLNIKL